MDATASWNDLVSALHVRNWYAIVALVMMVGIQFFRRHPVASSTWQKLPVGWRWVPAVAASFSFAFVRAYLAKLPVLDAIAEGIGGIAGIAVPAMGMAAWLKESPLPWDGGAGGKVTLVLALLLPLPTFVAGCSSQKADTGASVARSEHLAYNTAEVVLALLASNENATDAEKARLERIRQALAVAKEAIGQGKHEDAATALREIFTLLKLAVEEAKADGLKLPDAVTSSVNDAAGLFGADG